MGAVSPALRLAASRLRPFSRQISLAVAFPFIWMLVSSITRNNLAGSEPFVDLIRYKAVPITGIKIPVTIVNDTFGGLAVCLDGTPPGFHFQAGSGEGADKWVIFLEGGAWCDSVNDCYNRSLTKLGSSNHMQPYSFIGILSPNPAINPEFFSWNRVVVRYCDGASFSGNKSYRIKVPGTNTFIFFRGKHIMPAIVSHLLQHHNLRAASHVLFGGGSAGALAAFLHCDWFARTMLEVSQQPNSSLSASAPAADGATGGTAGAPATAAAAASASSPSSSSPPPPVVKCMGDGGVFLDTKDVGGQHEMRKRFSAVVRLQNVSVHEGCFDRLTNRTAERWKCFFPEYFLPLLHTPLFIGNTLYDSWQMNYSFAIPASFKSQHWDECRLALVDCPGQLLRKFHSKWFAEPQTLGLNKQTFQVPWIEQADLSGALD
ncbi:unnamed protein product [Closterium sp. NIES-64]|nr:unnamed protein product [Closterium sp. NIES-64]